MTMTISLGLLARAIVRAYANRADYTAARLELTQVQNLAESHAELIVALGNYADEDECASWDGETCGKCCACIAQGVLDRARKL